MTDPRQAAQQAEPCIGKDPRCPCQDGDACHYKDCGNTKAWPVPQAEPVARKDFEKWAKSLPNYMDLSRFETGYSDCNTDYAWAAWKAALAQPQQQAEPSKWRDMVVVTLVREGIDKHRARELADHFAAQPEPVPVAWMVTYGGLTHVEYTLPSKVVDTHYQPLYTAPPATQPPPEWEAINNIIAEYGLDAIAFVAEWKAAQRPWQGLTPEEVLDLFDRNNVYGSKWVEFARTVEAKLKAKNDY